MPTLADLRTDEQGNWIDPRICPRTFYDGSTNMFEEDFKKNHPGDDGHWYGPDNYYVTCAFCDVRKEDVRESFYHWRYENVITKLTYALGRLG